MILLHVFVLVTQSLALEFALPSSFGGKTEFSERGWRVLLGQLSPDMKLGRAPIGEVPIAQEPTCFEQVTKCSTTYFGRQISFRYPATAQLWVKWHEDATPFACDSPEGCTVTSTKSVVDLTSQNNGYSVVASLNAKVATEDGSPVVNGQGRSLMFRYSNVKTKPTTLTSKRTLTVKCLENHMCYIQTGTLMMTVSGMCESKPLLVCDQHYFPCERFNREGLNMCSQWDEFTQEQCRRGNSDPDKQECSMSVAVTGANGKPIGFQVFEQKPMPGRENFVKRDYDLAKSPFGELPDGSTGAWIAWSS